MATTMRELMTTDLVQIDAEQPIAEAARQMRDASVGDVLVLRNGQLDGIVTDRDIVVRGIAEGVDPKTAKIGSIATGKLATLSPQDDSDQAVQLMRENAIRRVPVVENEVAIGIVSIGDLAQERDRKSALGEISAATPNR